MLFRGFPQDLLLAFQFFTHPPGNTNTNLQRLIIVVVLRAVSRSPRAEPALVCMFKSYTINLSGL